MSNRLSLLEWEAMDFENDSIISHFMIHKNFWFCIYKFKTKEILHILISNKLIHKSILPQWDKPTYSSTLAVFDNTGWTIGTM